MKKKVNSLRRADFRGIKTNLLGSLTLADSPQLSVDEIYFNASYTCLIDHVTT